VARYVAQIKEDEQVVAQIRSYEARLRSLSGKEGEEAAAEQAEVAELLHNAETVERQLRRKRDTIKLLEHEVETLYRELRKL
jgi:FtsZ-binding cell division protein ZapB